MKYVKETQTGVLYYPFLIRKRNIFYSEIEQNKVILTNGAKRKHPYIFMCFVKNKIFTFNGNGMRFYALDNYYPKQYILNKDVFVAGRNREFLQRLMLCALENEELAKKDEAVANEISLLILYSKIKRYTTMLYGNRTPESMEASRCMFSNEEDQNALGKIEGGPAEIEKFYGYFDDKLMGFYGGSYRYASFDGFNGDLLASVPYIEAENAADGLKKSFSEVSLAAYGDNFYGEKYSEICEDARDNGVDYGTGIIDSAGGVHTLTEILENTALESERAQIALDPAAKDYECEVKIAVEDLSCQVEAQWYTGGENATIFETYAGIPLSAVKRGAFDVQRDPAEEPKKPLESIIIKAGGGLIDLTGLSNLKTVTFEGQRTTFPIFKDCTSLEEIVIPDGVKEIPNNALEGCSSLSSVIMGRDVEVIGNGAFMGCTSLNSVTWSESLKRIGELAFCECSSLSEAHLPDSLEELGTGGFDECTSLTQVSFGKNFSGKIGGFTNCSSLQKVEVNSEAKYQIGRNAFRGCDNLTELQLSEGLTGVEPFLPENCKITEQVFPMSVTSFPVAVEFPEGFIVKTEKRNDAIWRSIGSEERVQYVSLDGTAFLDPADEAAIAHEQEMAELIKQQEAYAKKQKQEEEEIAKQAAIMQQEAEAQAQAAQAAQANAMAGMMENFQKAQAAAATMTGGAPISGLSGGIPGLPGGIPGLGGIPGVDGGITGMSETPGAVGEILGIDGASGLDENLDKSEISDEPEITDDSETFIESDATNLLGMEENIESRPLVMAIGESGNSYIPLYVPAKIVDETANDEQVPAMLMGNYISVAYQGSLNKNNLCTNAETRKNMPEIAISQVNSTILTMCETNDAILKENEFLYDIYKAIVLEKLEAAGIERVNGALATKGSNIKIEVSSDGTRVVKDSDGVAHSLQEILWSLSMK
ncbi:MAG: leucine-rich repeat domain-containing protein [Lachnospiraceae bacterium]|nr:leucine-rich repeat domain-containing protein [Lachnospiraceae bacterium]